MKLNSKSGFSLVELMVVVAIIGILVTIAAPNLTRFQAKAKQSAAKTELTGLYTAEQAFFTEFATYHGRLPYVGYVPDGCTEDGNCTGMRYYTVGFQNPGIDVQAAGGPALATAPATYRYLNSAGTALTGGTTAADSFTASAAGRVTSGADVDQWRINNRRQLENAAAAAAAVPDAE